MRLGAAEMPDPGSRVEWQVLDPGSRGTAARSRLQSELYPRLREDAASTAWSRPANRPVGAGPSGCADEASKGAGVWLGSVTKAAVRFRGTRGSTACGPNPRIIVRPGWARAGAAAAADDWLRACGSGGATAATAGAVGATAATEGAVAVNTMCTPCRMRL